MPEPNRKLGPYTLVSRIGLGGFGVVWLAEKRTSIATTQFALKLPRGEDIDLDTFKQEAVIWLQASGHPNVLPLIDADIYDDQVVIVSEYVPDGSLASWLKQNGGKAPTPEAAVEIMDGVLAGLNHLHQRRIIHRDLKPENILLQRETPRLADFGIARLLKSSSHSAHVSGTLAYMAPEAFDGKRNEQTDVWSVGVIFYQMLSGRLPYNQTDIPSFIGAIMRHDPPALPDSVPEVLRQIVMKALQRDPANRYSSATEMRSDLREAEHQLWLGSRKTDVTPEQPTIPAITPTAPQAGPVGPVEPQPTIPFSPAVTRPYVEPARQTVPSETTPAPPKRRGRGKIVLAGVVGGLLLVALLTLGGFKLWLFLNDLSLRTLSGHTTEVKSVAFSPDGKFIASCSTRSGPTTTLLELWDAKTGKSVRAWNGHGGAVYSVAFSPDSKTLASAASDSVKLWEVQTGALTRTWAPWNSNNYVQSVAFSPDGRTLATGGEDNMVRLWDIQTGDLRRTLAAGRWLGIDAIAFSPDGSMIAAASQEIKVWDVASGTLKKTLTTRTGSSAVAFSQDGQKIAGAFHETVVIWNTTNYDVISKFTAPDINPNLNAIAFSPDGKIIAAGSGDWIIHLVDVPTGKLTKTLTGHRKAVNSVAFSPDGKTLASGGDDMTVKLWRIP